MPHPDARRSGGGELAAEFTAAKALFRQAGRQDLCDWVDQELSGYPQSGRLPPYRQVPAIARGTVTQDEERLDNHRLPVWHLAGDWTHEPMRQGLAQIEAWAASSEPCLLQPIHPHEHALFTRGLRLGGGHAVTEAWWEIRTEALSSVLLDGAREQLHRTLRMLQSSQDGEGRGDANLNCRKCGSNIEFSPFRAESLKRFRQFMALAGLLLLVAWSLYLLRVELWPWWVGGTGIFVMSQALLKWQDSRWVICKHCRQV